MNNAFCFILKAFFVLKILILYFNSFGYVEIRLDKRAEVNFKIYDVTNWEKNNYNKHCHISQKVKAARQRSLFSSKNLTCEIFFFKNHGEKEARRLVLYFFMFLKNHYKKKQSAKLVSIIYFCSP